MSFQQENQGQVVSLKQYLKIFPYICQKQLERKVYEAQHCQAQSVTLQHERLEERSCWSRTQGVSWHLFFTKDSAVLEFRLTKSWRKKKQNKTGKDCLKLCPTQYSEIKNEQMPRTPSALFRKKAKHGSLLFWIHTWMILHIF